jgi:hypothetical protein
MSLLTRDQILDAEDIKTELVKVPEWGGDVNVKMFTATERDAFEESIVTRNGDDVKTNLENFRAKLCAATMVNENGRQYFPNPKDVKLLGKKSAKALDRVFAVAQSINGMSKDDVEELTKNSSAGQSDDSISA